MFEMLLSLSPFLLLSCVVGRLEAFAEVDLGVQYNPNSIERFATSDDADVEFLLFTKDNTQDPTKVAVDDKGELFNGKLDVKKPTKVIIHGWMDSWEKIYPQTMIASYLPKFDYNVIVVNWPEADNLLYFVCRGKVPVVGNIVSRLLDRLENENGLNLSSVHVIGHSLGAHVAAVAGFTAKSKIGRITGLDPALPMFSVGGADTLSTKAADFVEVVHTCAHVAGLFDEIGHVDFYPNGGVPFQPGCILNLSCSHKRAFKLYSEAVTNSTAFLATECSDWATYENGDCAENQKIFMTGSTSISARGKFFFKTAASSPFGLGPQS